jgi:glutamine synthetase
MTPKEVIELAKKHDVKFVDLKFIDFPGRVAAHDHPGDAPRRELFEDGMAFDGSSIRGWQPINASDMVMIPDPETAKIDPFYATRRSASSARSSTRSPSSPTRATRATSRRRPRRTSPDRHRRHVVHGARGRVLHLRRRPLRSVAAERRASTTSTASRAQWNSGREEFPNLGYKTRHKEGYFPVPPTDTLADLRQADHDDAQESGVEVEVGHHEVASGGQCEIGMKFNRLLPCADQLMWFKYVVKNVARKHGKAATFMPKPLFGDNGSGMHVHQSSGRRASPSSAATATRASRTWRSTTSAASSSTPSRSRR